MNSMLNLPVIVSDAKTDASQGLVFRSWHFATFKAQLQLDGPAHDICGNTGCTMSLIDCAFLQQSAPHIKIRHSNIKITVRGIGAQTHDCSKYTIITILILGMVDQKPAFASITHQLHIVDQLQAKVLIGLDILGPEQAIFNIDRQVLIWSRCKNLEARLTVTPKATRTTGQIVLANKLTTVPLNSVMPVPIRIKSAQQLPLNQNFLFQSIARRLNLGN